MRKIDTRQGLMLFAAGLLIMVMLTVFVRLGTTKVLVKRAHMDNLVTKMILYGNANLQKSEPSGADNNKIDWKTAYPFADIDRVEEPKWLTTQKIKKKVKAVEKKIDEWTGKNLFGYYKLAEFGRNYDTFIKWGLTNQKNEIISLGDGAWTWIEQKAHSNVQEKTTSLIDFARTVEKNGAKFLYVQAPVKTDPYNDFAVNGTWDFSNLNCDMLLEKLSAQNIPTIDLRQDLHRWAQSDHVSYHDFFFRTDHHWKPETALRAAKVVGKRLQEYGIYVDYSHYTLHDFDMEIIPQFFLGSQGKRATLSLATPDDFPILHPSFTTQLHFRIPELAFDKIGNFEITYNYNEIAKQDYYNSNPHAMYGYGEKAIINIENLMLPPSKKKILLIRDSYCNTMGPFLALGINNVTMLDLRVFTGSLKSYIAVHKPDVVIVMYTDELSKKIDWTSHADLFDFR